jgi:SEC-C motif-containing protein
MRSRYAAFALGLETYLLRSWHASTRPSSLELDPKVEWQRLFIEEVSAGGPFDDAGEVTFTAVARTAEGRMRQRERSRFARDTEGRWCYVDGTPL